MSLWIRIPCVPYLIPAGGARSRSPVPCRLCEIPDAARVLFRSAGMDFQGRGNGLDRSGIDHDGAIVGGVWPGTTTAAREP